MLTARITAPGRTPVDVSHLVSARGDHGFLRARALSESTILISAFGDVDAASAEDLREGIERHLKGHCQVVLDLSRLDFFGTAGFSVLKSVHEHCERAGIDWILVPGLEVQRLLRICDPGGALPTATNIVAAVAALSRLPRRMSLLRVANR